MHKTQNDHSSFNKKYTYVTYNSYLYKKKYICKIDGYGFFFGFVVLQKRLNHLVNYVCRLSNNFYMFVWIDDTEFGYRVSMILRLETS